MLGEVKREKECLLIGINGHLINYHSQMPFAGAPKVIVIYLWSVFLNDEYAEC